MKVLDSYWYTPTAPGFDPLSHHVLGQPDIGVAEANTKMEDRIADSGAKVLKEVACAHFPQLDPAKFVY